MTDRTRKLLDEVLALPPEERMDFLDQLILLESEQAGGYSSPEIAAEWEKEIARRIEEIDSGKVQAIPWEEVKREMNRATGDVNGH